MIAPFSRPRPRPHVLLLAPCREPAPDVALPWALVAPDAPLGSPPLEEGRFVGGEEADARLAALCRAHAAVLVLPPDTVSHFCPTAPRGVRRSEWPLLLEDQVATEVSELALAALDQRPGRLELVAVEHRLLRAWQAWLAERDLEVAHWASGFMGLPAPESPDHLRVLADDTHWMLKSRETDPEGAPGSERWLAWPREWHDLLPPDLSGRTWQPAEDLGADEVPAPGARLALYGRHLPTRLPDMPFEGGRSRRAPTRLAWLLGALLLAHGGLSVWSLMTDGQADEPTAAATPPAVLLQRNARLEGVLARLEQHLGERPPALERFEVEGQHLSLAWSLAGQADPAGLAAHLEGVGHLVRDDERLTLDVTLTDENSTAGGAR